MENEAIEVSNPGGIESGAERNGLSKAPISPAEMEALVSQQTELLKKTTGLCLSLSHAKDWIDIDGKPYLTGSGAKAVCGWFGIKIHTPHRVTRERDKDGHLSIVMEGYVESRRFGTGMPEVGACNGAKLFYSKRHNVDETDIEKHAFTNYQARCIKSIMGLGNLTWDEVESISNGRVNRHGKAKIEHKAPQGQTPATNATTGQQTQPQGNSGELLELQKLIAGIVSVDKSQSADKICNKYFRAKDGKVLGYEDVRKFHTEKQMHWLGGATVQIKKDFANILPPAEPEPEEESSGN